LPAPVHLDLVTYAEVLARASGCSVSDPGKLVRQCSHDSWQLIAHSKKFVIDLVANGYVEAGEGDEFYKLTPKAQDLLSERGGGANES
jgi:hypothetical protein